jgi:hypothetical protein
LTGTHRGEQIHRQVIDRRSQYGETSEGPMWMMSPVEVAIFMTLIVGALAWVLLA